MFKEFFDELEKKNIRLNDQQRNAVTHKDGPCLVLAVPGGGKTTVLLSRIGFLTKMHAVPSENILSITFSNASAEDMKERAQERFSDFEIESDFMTIHSLANKIVRDYDKMHRIKRTLIETENGSAFTKRKLIKDLYLKHNLEDINDERLDDVMSAIGITHNLMLNEAEYSQFDIPKFGEIFNDYETIKREQNLIDYDGMLTEAYKILSNEPLIFNKYQYRYDYIQVDEAQDTSLIQHAIIKKIANNSKNVFFVSDDDQSIYGFRGSFPDFLIKIDDFYDNVTKYFMEQNYRSTPTIVNAANALIANNKVRYKKDIFTQNPDGDKIDIISVIDGDAQIDNLVKRVEKSKKFNEVAILYRTHMSSIAIANKLMQRGIPFSVRGFNNYFFKHWIFEDVKTLLELAIRQDDPAKLERVIKKIPSRVTPLMVQYAKNYPKTGNVFDDMLDNPSLLSDEKDAISKLKWKFNALASKSPENAIEFIENGFKLLDHIEKTCEKTGYSFEGLKRILSSAKNIARTSQSILGFLSTIEVLEMEMEASAAETEGVVLTTIHSCKGLEWDEVYMVDLINNSFPSYQALDAQKNDNTKLIEEERRLFYVGMTRARKKLHLYKVFNLNGNPVEESIFLKEVDEILFPNKVSNLMVGVNASAPVHPSGKKPAQPTKRVKKTIQVFDTKGFDVGVHVTHINYGSGLVRENDGDVIKIEFSAGIKALKLEICIEKSLIEKK